MKPPSSAPVGQQNPNNGPILVSVVIPAYQAGSHVAQALDSVLGQTFSQYEIILVNDGSPDTEALEIILQPYRSHIRYFQQENQGPSSARNAGILAAQGKYVAFLDSDDYWLPHHLASQVELLKRDPGVGLAYANCLLTRNGVTIGTSFQLSPQAQQATFETLLREQSRIGTSSVVASREAILDAGLFDESLRRCEDFDLWLRIAHHGSRITYDGNVHVCHRRKNGLASDAELMKRALIQVFQKAAELPIPEQQRRYAQDRVVELEAELQLEIARKSLVAEEFGDALEAARRASANLDSWKVRLAVLGLRLCPHTFRQSYRAYVHLLEMRRRMRTARWDSKLPRAL
jgi:glycosyltransferase involved in cell wall biosynthesis